MKKRIIGLCIWLVAGASFGKEAPEFRTFTSAEGQKIQARILRYDIEKERIFIERIDGIRTWTVADIFSVADKAYINKWIDADCAVSEKSLKVSVKTCRGRADKEMGLQARAATVNNREHVYREEAVYYEICLENCSEDDVRNLEVQYRIIKTVSGSGIKKSDIQVGGSEVVELIKQGQQAVVCSEAVSEIKVTRDEPQSYDDILAREGATSKEISEEEIEGIWIKIHSPKVEGKSIVRDVYYPQRLQQDVYKWRPLEKWKSEEILSSEADAEELKKEIVEGFDSFFGKKKDYSLTPPPLEPLN